MRPRRSRAGGLSRSVGIIVILLALVGCSGPAATSRRGESGTTAVLADSAMPAEALVQRLVGVPMAELRRRVDVARVRVAISCVEARGYTLDEAQVRSLEHIPPPPPPFGGNVASVVMARLGRSADPTSAMPDELRSALERCLVEAQTSFVDPFDAFDEWLADVLADINARVNADPRYLAAAEEEKACIRALGYASGDVAEVANAMTNRANEVIDRFDAGTLSRTDLEAELEGLTTAELTLADQVIPCVAIRLDVERTIAGEVQSEALERQGAAIGELLRTLKGRLHELGLDSQS
jgi:hypothetical protein